MQGIVDQMQAAVAQLISWDITLRDIKSGLIDFPALVNGRQVCLCWRLGEDTVEWWHELATGFSGRKRIAELVRPFHGREPASTAGVRKPTRPCRSPSGRG